MAEVNTDKGKGDGKKGKQKKVNIRVDADGGYEYATDHVLHALYFAE